MNHCLVCGTMNEEEALQCVVCSAELNTYNNQAHLAPSQASSHIVRNPRSPFTSSGAAFNFSDIDPQLLQAEQHLKSLTLNPYTASASKVPRDDGLLGPEDIMLSMAPLAFDAQAELRQATPTWVGSPHLDAPNPTPNQVSSDTLKQANHHQIHQFPMDPSQQVKAHFDTPNQSPHIHHQSESMADMAAITHKDPSEFEISEIEMQHFPSTAVGYAQEEVAQALQKAKHQAIHSSVAVDLHAPSDIDANTLVGAPHQPAHTQGQIPANVLEYVYQGKAQVNAQAHQVMQQDSISQVQELPALTQEEIQRLSTTHAHMLAESKAKTQLALSTSLEPVTLKGSISVKELDANASPIPKADADLSQQSNQKNASKWMSTEITPVTHPLKKSRLKWFKNLIILLLSLALLFLVLNLLKLDHYLYTLTPPQLTYQVQSTHLVEQFYEVQLTVQSDTALTLELPEGWIKNSTAPHVEVKESKKIVLRIPSDQLQLGHNALSVQGRDQNDQVIPLNLSIPLVYRLGKVGAIQSNQVHKASLVVAQDWSLVESNVQFELIDQNGSEGSAKTYTLSIPHQAHKKGKLSIQMTFENSKGIRKKYQEERSSKLGQIHFTLFAPIRNIHHAARQFHVRGQTISHARVSIGQQTIKANKEGFFEGLINVDKVGKHVLPVIVEATGYTKYRTKITLKRDRESKWKKFYKNLKKKGTKLRKKYPKYTYTALKYQQGKALKKKRIRMNGKVAWIDRNEGKKWQYLLLFACQPAACPVWVQVEQANWINIGSRIQVFGTYEGYTEHKMIRTTPLSAPNIKAKFVTP